MSTDSHDEVVDGVWRFKSLHSEWAEEIAGEDGYDPLVAWWAIRVPIGLVLVDPLVDDWSAIDQLTDAEGGCVGIVRTCNWHQRSVAEASERYSAAVWAGPPKGEGELPAFDHELFDRGAVFDRIVAYDMERVDEIALWLPGERTLIFGDAMIRRADGELRLCPESWTQPEGGPARLRELVRALTELPVEHVLVAHGPLVLGDGLQSLRAATGYGR